MAPNTPTILWGSMGPDSHAIDTAFERGVGRRQSLVHMAQPWAYGRKSDGTPNYAPFPAQTSGAWSFLPQPYAGGQMVMLDWASWDLTSGTDKLDPLFTLDTILAGAHDAFLQQWARDAAAFGQPLMLRFNSEMNGGWWANFGAQPDKFVQAWRHVVSLFKNEHADNIAWYWCVNYTSPPGAPYPTSSDKLATYYPGNDVVDWTGFDTYNESMSRVVLDANGKMVDGWVVPWFSPAQTLNGAWTPGTPPFSWFGPTYDAILKVAPTKPMCIGEFGCDDRPSTTGDSLKLIGNGNRVAWLLEFLTTIPRQFPAIRAISYFNWNPSSQTHWALKPAELAAIAGALASPVYLAAGDWVPSAGQPLLAPARTLTLASALPAEYQQNGWTSWEQAAAGLAARAAQAASKVDELNGKLSDATTRVTAAEASLNAVRTSLQILQQVGSATA